tara:strand:- start:7811 stop:8464 length:654 start_codon:yes stop_codon:yes gene_type:complete
MAIPFAAIGTGLSIASNLFGLGKGDDSAWKAQHNRNITEWHIGKNKHDNSLAALKINEAGRHLGYSKTKGQIDHNRLNSIGKTRRDIVTLERERFGKQKVADLKGGGTRARGFGKSTNVYAYLAKRSDMEQKIRNEDVKAAILSEGAKEQFRQQKKYPGIAPAYHEAIYTPPKVGLGDVLGAVGSGMEFGAGLDKSIGQMASSKNNMLASFGKFLGG